jgi:hypothetical protein
VVSNFLACSLSYFPDINTAGVKMNRNSKATPSPNELASLRGLGVDLKREISRSHRQVLASMGLIVSNEDELNLTDAGRQRLDHEERTILPGGAPNHIRPRPRMCGSAGGKAGGGEVWDCLAPSAF